jgi:hypothetical protein
MLGVLERALGVVGGEGGIGTRMCRRWRLLTVIVPSSHSFAYTCTTSLLTP